MMILKWFTAGWWRYLFSEPYHADLTLRILLCRIGGHPGEVFWNPGGWEPDHHCIRCGEDIG